MQFTLATLLSLTALATAQVTYDPTTNTFTCAKQTGAYCASGSLKSNIIIRCNAGKGQPGNCNDNLAGIPPIGVKTSALCYESSATAADAACSFNGIVYPGNGNSSFPVPPAGGNGTQTTSTPIGTPTATFYTSLTGVVSPPAGTGAAGTGSGSGSGGAGSTGTGGSGPSGPTATWAPTGVPSQTPLPTSNAGSAVSGNWALLPAAGFLAFLL